MSVAVLSKNGMLLMPTSEYRARKLLKSKKAIIHRYHPFTERQSWMLPDLSGQRKTTNGLI